MPLVLLVGPNSSGKSSILKALLAFKQTYEDQGDHAGFLSKGEYVDVGPFVEYVRDHDIRTKCHFEFLIRLGRSAATYRNLPHTGALNLVHELDPQTGHGRLAEYRLSLIAQDDDLSEFWRPESRFPCTIRYRKMQKSEESYRLSVSRPMYDYFRGFLDQRRHLLSRRRELPSFESLSQYLSQGHAQARRTTERGMTTFAVHTYDAAALNFVSSLENLIVQRFHTTFVADLTEYTYALAALREIPQRSGHRTDERYRVGSRGQNTASVYLNFRQRAIKAGKRQSKIKEDFWRLEDWIKKLRLTQRVDLSSWRDLVDVRASMGHGKTTSHSIVDVGVGVSQTLPILVQLAVIPEGSRLILEQPELHLYPWAQAEMGRLLCDEAKRGNKKLLIETHSEHIIRGAQRHVSNARPIGSDKYLTHEEVAVLYVHDTGRIQRLHLDPNGEFVEPWPEGFFDQGLEAFSEIMDNKTRPAKTG